jgi:hypothetical protein
MGILLTFTLISAHLLVLGLLIRVFFVHLRRQDEIIRETRLREQQLIDRLLVKAGHTPLIEREQVVKIPDPEIRQPDFVELAFREDEIMEEVEMMNASMQGRGADYVKQLYPSLWEEAEKRFNIAHKLVRS